MEKQIKPLSIALSLGLMVAVQSLPVNVNAGTQIYPASSCVPWTSSDPVPSLSSSRIFNTSATRDMRVDCPILHQNFDILFGNNLDNVLQEMNEVLAA